MTLKQKIHTDFVTAFKAKDEAGKSALSYLKSEITKVEKANKNVELDDAGVLKVLVTSVKQRKQSIEEFTKGGRIDLATKETTELAVIEAYLPKPLSKEEIATEAAKILATFGESDNRNRKVGQTLGQLNKLYTGRIDSKLANEVINSLV